MTELAAHGYGEDGPEGLSGVLHGSPYVAYTYSYPHKTSYRPFDAPLPLEELWQHEDRSSLFLYVHIPFCEMRCGFCNLFTYARPDGGLASRYLDALERQARLVAELLGESSWARLAVGGGTPTQLDEAGLERLHRIIEQVMRCDVSRIPSSVEASPETVSADKLALLRAFGVDRLSIGVQSFIPEETRAVRRPQEPAVVHRALSSIREAGFPVLNVDLIYGIRGQTVASFETSIAETLRYDPEEVFLYPLYVRPLTGLGNSPRRWSDERLALYRAGREALLTAGYRQVSMRLFRKPSEASEVAPSYRCQEDGMVGLGAGARSYTERVHYCTEYAVGRRGVAAILEDFVERDDAAHRHAQYGIRLQLEEQKRRHVILSLLTEEGIDPTFYRRRFQTDVFEDFPQISTLLEADLAARDSAVRLTARGLERSDAIGPWLYSRDVRARMQEYELR